MLRASRRALRPGAHIAFHVIAIGADLSATEVDRAVELGPPHVHSVRDYATLMQDAGFEEVVIVDVSDDYVATLEGKLHAWTEGRNEIRAIVGDAEFDNRQSRRANALEAAEAGLLVRWEISARRP